VLRERQFSFGNPSAWIIVARTMRPASQASLRMDRSTTARILTDSTILDAVLAIGEAVHKLHQTEAVAERLLTGIMELIPADRGVVLLAEPLAWEPARFAIESELPARVRRDGVAVMTAAPTSLLCAPLGIFDLNLGAVYLESLRPNAFTARDLHLLAAIASTVALKLEDTEYTERIRYENDWLRDFAKPGQELLGNSPAIQQVREFIGSVAGADTTVLILGESGTGKEVVARSIHRLSPRAKKPYMAVNCGAFVETLIETELFGYERGAFTGAAEMKKGNIEEARGGTLFLDEIGELPLQSQSALLRVLQEREFQRVGGANSIRADVRIIAATNRNLKQWVEQGRFRADLYYRLNVVDIRTPSLAEIAEDIPLLAENFIRKFDWMRPVTGVSPKAQEILMRYSWPGNVRELENVIHRAFILGKSNLIQPEDLSGDIRNTNSNTAAAAGYRRSTGRHRNDLIDQAVADHNGSVPAAARHLGLSEGYIYRVLRNSKRADSHR
jgi:DNA-binding NtrC family response regulator